MQSEHEINSAVLLSHILTCKSEAEIGVQGVSMEPTLYEGDTIRVVKGEYKLGDILVFTYKYGELLVHRYVGEQYGRILCKGDNSLRLEDIDRNVIIGKVESFKINGKEYHIPPLSPELISMSYQVGRLFRKNRYDPVLTRDEPLYSEFRNSMVEYASFRESIPSK